MPVYRVGNNTYVSRLQHAGTTPSNSGGAANTANATFGRVRPAVLLEEEREQPLDFIFVDVGSGATQLVIDDASHAHAADNLALTQHNVLVIQDASHGHTADNVALTQHNVLAIQDATHGHTADNVVLGVGLVIQDAAHGHVADSPTLTQHNVLAIADALHAHAADNVALTQHNVLVIQDALHGHAADNVALTQHNVLAVQDALHAHAADNVVLTAHDPSGTVLVIQDGAHAHSADNVTLAQHNILVIQDALHAHRATDHWDGAIHFDGTGSVDWSSTTITIDDADDGDFWDASDGGSIVYRTMPGPQVEQALTTPPSGGSGDRRSFMLRKSTAANSAFYCLHFDADYSHITTLWRDTDGAIANYPGQNTGVAWNGTDSIRFRLAYDGTTAFAYVSLAGGAWQLVGSRAIAGLTLVCLVEGGNPTGTTNPAVWTRDPVTLTQHNVLAIDDAFHAHTADHINDIGGDPGTIEQEDIVRLRRRRQPIGT